MEFLQRLAALERWSWSFYGTTSSETQEKKLAALERWSWTTSQEVCIERSACFSFQARPKK